MEKTYHIQPEKVEAYLREYYRRNIFTFGMIACWALAVFIGVRYNITAVPAVAFGVLILLAALSGNIIGRKNTRIEKRETLDYLKSYFVITDDYIERIHNSKSAGKLRFKTQFTIVESNWGIEARTYTFIKNRPVEKWRAETSNRLWAAYRSYYTIYIPSITEQYDELRALLIEKAKQ